MYHSYLDDWLTQFSLNNMHKRRLKHNNLLVYLALYLFRCDQIMRTSFLIIILQGQEVREALLYVR